jgi:5'-nucleotidase
LHSGTVGAALTAAAGGRPALSVSLDVGGEPGERSHWDTAAGLIGAVLPLLSEQFALNLNVPNLPRHRLRGLREARLASFGTVQTTIEEADRGSVEVAVDDTDPPREPDTDQALLAAGYASLTPLTPPREARVAPLVIPQLPMPDPA